MIVVVESLLGWKNNRACSVKHGGDTGGSMIDRRRESAHHDVGGVNVVSAFSAGQRCQADPCSFRCSQIHRERGREGGGAI